MISHSLHTLPIIDSYNILILTLATPRLQERIIAPERAYRASERGSSKFYDERRKQLPAWKPAGAAAADLGHMWTEWRYNEVVNGESSWFFLFKNGDFPVRYVS